jgi:hypothetical protein
MVCEQNPIYAASSIIESCDTLTIDLPQFPQWSHRAREPVVILCGDAFAKSAAAF